MKQCTHFFADGTFGTAPPQFSQIYSLHSLKDGYNLPLAFGFLPNKSAATYERFFREIQQLAPEMAPETLMADFELSAWAAWKITGPLKQRRSQTTLNTTTSEGRLEDRGDGDPHFSRWNHGISMIVPNRGWGGRTTQSKLGIGDFG